jgi:N-methylhydantoinase B
MKLSAAPSTVASAAAGVGVAQAGLRLEIVKNAFESIADGMALTVVRTSRSSVVRSGLDFSTAILDHNGQLIGQGMCMPIHLGGMMPALEACLERYPEVRPGDVFINNDPYEGGSHLPDIFLYQPFFVDDTLVGYGCAMAHQTDIGGRVAGGNACDSTEIYQEGLRIPPLKLYEEGKANETLFRLLEKAVRLPETVLGDVRAQLSALRYAERELANLVGRYGVQDFLSLGSELLDYTERMTRAALRTLPDGEWTFTDYVDDDGITNDVIPIVVTLRKQGDELTADFTGTGPQCRGAIQPVFPTTKAMVYSALKNVLGVIASGVPNTAGYFRPVTVLAPEGTFVNPLPPAPVAARALGLIRIHQTLLGAFAQMLPDQIYACSGGCEFGLSLSGYDRTQTPAKAWIQLEFLVESAVGGFAFRDGQDAHVAGAANAAVIPIETLELEQPIVIEEFALIPDSEGAGKHRGGLGLRRRYRFLADETQVQMRCDRTKHAPFGLFGGEGSKTTTITIEAKGRRRRMPGKFITTVGAGDRMQVDMPGAGGWGNPAQRDPELVLQDVSAEKVSVQRARSKYRVVISADKQTIDQAATDRLRRRTARDGSTPGQG